MGRWFRVHDDLVDDPKVQLLSGDLVKALLNLWCLASQNEGVLPSMKDMAFKLRMKPQQIAAVIAELSAAGLIDRDGDEYRPHNWDKRQYKSDTDKTAADRSKRYRAKHRDVTRDGDRDGNACRERPYTEQKQTTEQIDKIGEAASKFTEGSKGLADAFLGALGFDTPLKVPPEFAGVDWRAITWESAGWTADMIVADAKRIGPDKPLTYYEKVFATSFAKRQAPLPVVEVREAEKLMVTHGRNEKTQSLSDVARRHAEAGISFGERPTIPSLRVLAGGSDVRLLSQGGGERPGDIRGSDGSGS